MYLIKIVASLVLVLALPVLAFAEGFPDHPVRFICPLPPGGDVDFVTRVLATKLSEFWGQPVVVDNRAGASGTIGAAGGA